MSNQAVVIGGKERKARGKYGHYWKLTKKYPDMDKADQWPLRKFDEFVMDALWMMLVRRPWALFTKPYVLKRFLRYNISIKEIEKLREVVPTILMGNDSEDGTEKK